MTSHTHTYPLLNIYRFSHEPIEGVARLHIETCTIYWDVMISIQYFGIPAAAAAVAIVFNQNPTPRTTSKFMAEQKMLLSAVALVSRLIHSHNRMLSEEKQNVNQILAYSFRRKCRQ